MSDADSQSRLVAVDLDSASIARAPPDIEHERAVAIYDLVEANIFVLPDHPGPIAEPFAADDPPGVQLRSEAASR
jgi:uncharacterized protein (UPF0262 family)